MSISYWDLSLNLDLLHSATCLLSPHECLSVLNYWSSTPAGSSLILVEPSVLPLSPPWLHLELQDIVHTCMTTRAGLNVSSVHTLICPCKQHSFLLPGPRGCTPIAQAPLEPVGRLHVVWAGNSVIQKPEKSPLTLVLLGFGVGMAACRLVLHTLPLLLPISGTRSKSLPSYPGAEQQLFLHILLSTVVHPKIKSFPLSSFSLHLGSHKDS